MTTAAVDVEARIAEDEAWARGPECPPEARETLLQAASNRRALLEWAATDPEAAEWGFDRQLAGIFDGVDPRSPGRRIGEGGC